MIKAFFLGFASCGILVLGLASSAQSPMAPAFFLSEADIASGIEETLGDRPNMGVGRITTTDDWRINMIHRTAAATPIVHERGTEIHFITGGEGTLVTGGVVVTDQNGVRSVDGGKAQVVREGDFVLVPDGTPHPARSGRRAEPLRFLPAAARRAALAAGPAAQFEQPGRILQSRSVLRPGRGVAPRLSRAPAGGELWLCSAFRGVAALGVPGGLAFDRRRLGDTPREPVVTLAQGRGAASVPDELASPVRCGSRAGGGLVRREPS